MNAGPLRVGGYARPVRRYLVVGLALALVVGLLAVGVVVWRRLDRTPVERALDGAPSGSLRVAFTDWSVVRREVGVRLGEDPADARIEDFMAKAYDGDYTAASSIDEAAVALHNFFGFGPVNARWEAFSQSRKGAAMTLAVADGTDFGVLADNLRSAGYTKPEKDDGVWEGGADLVSLLDPTFSPEVQYIVLLEDEGLVVTSDDPGYAATAAKAATGDGPVVGEEEGIGDLVDPLEEPANAMFWAGDFACEDLAMSRADSQAQDQADRLVEDAGGVTPLAGLAMAMRADRTLRVVEHFEDGDVARKNLRPRAVLAVGEAPGRGISFSDDFELTTSRTSGSNVVLDLRPREPVGYVLSALYDGPLILATC